MEKCKEIQKSNLSTSCCDAIGKPDPISNLRPIKFHIPEVETELERHYRIERLKVQEWNNNFWTNHNKSFFQEKEEFARKNIKEGMSNQADKISMFYKDFLDRNWKTHFRYNIDWYKKNFYLSSLAFKINMCRFLRYCK